VQLFGSLLALLFVGGLLWWVVKGFLPERKQKPWNTRAESVSSANGLLILAAVNLSGLIVDLADSAVQLNAPPRVAAWVIALAALSALIVFVTNRSLGSAIVTFVGIGASLFNTAFRSDGQLRIIATIVIAAMLVWLLGFVRRIFG
jgi:hypothetical protein